MVKTFIGEEKIQRQTTKTKRSRNAGLRLAQRCQLSYSWSIGSVTYRFDDLKAPYPRVSARSGDDQHGLR